MRLSPPPPSDVAEEDEVAELERSGLFTADWYRERNPDVIEAELDPLLHFVRFGAAEGRWPNPWFDPAWYRANYPDVVAAELNPLLHYLRHGDEEGRQPSPHFAPNWYRAAHRLPKNMPALRHFLDTRLTGRFAPCAALYAVPGLPRYREDPAAGVDPFRHYLDDKEHEVLPDEALIADSGLVDANYYLLNGSDVHEAHLDPVLHFCRYGWREGRKPNLYFDTAWYCATNPRIERLKLNPLVHYLRDGETAGRRPVPYFDPAWYRETYGVPASQSALAHFLQHRRHQRVSPTPLFDVAWYVSRHGEEIGPNRDPFMHYLHAGTYADIDPSPAFSAADYRQTHLGRRSRSFGQLATPEKDNALVRFLIDSYGADA